MQAAAAPPPSNHENAASPPLHMHAAESGSSIMSCESDSGSNSSSDERQRVGSRVYARASTSGSRIHQQHHQMTLQQLRAADSETLVAHVLALRRELAEHVNHSRTQLRAAHEQCAAQVAHVEHELVRIASRERLERVNSTVALHSSSSSSFASANTNTSPKRGRRASLATVPIGDSTGADLGLSERRALLDQAQARRDAQRLVDAVALERDGALEQVEQLEETLALARAEVQRLERTMLTDRTAYEQLTVAYEQLLVQLDDVRQRASVQDARVRALESLVSISYRLERRLETLLVDAHDAGERIRCVVPVLLEQRTVYITYEHGGEHLPVAGLWLARLVRFWGWRDAADALRQALGTYVQTRLLAPVEASHGECSQDLVRSVSYAAASLALLGWLVRCEQAAVLVLEHVNSATQTARQLDGRQLRDRCAQLFAQCMRVLSKFPAERMARSACEALSRPQTGSAASVCDQLDALRVQFEQQHQLPRALVCQLMRNVLARLDDNVLHLLLSECNIAYTHELGVHLLVQLSVLRDWWRAYHSRASLHSGQLWTLDATPPMPRLEQLARVLLLSSHDALVESSVRLEVCPQLSLVELWTVVRTSKPQPRLCDEARRRFNELLLSTSSPRDNNNAEQATNARTAQSRIQRPHASLALTLPPNNNASVLRYLDGDSTVTTTAATTSVTAPIFDMDSVYALTFDEFQTLPPRAEWLTWFQPRPSSAHSRSNSISTATTTSSGSAHSLIHF